MTLVAGHRPAAARAAAARDALRRPLVVIAVLSVALLLALLVDLLVGRGFSAQEIIGALSDPGSVHGRILRLVRMPRAATAALAGAALGVAGMLLQTILRNPLASPELTGINGTVVLAVIVAVWTGAVAADAPLGLPAAALLGGLVGGTLTMLLAGAQPARVLLWGVLLAAASSGVATLLISLRSDAFGNVTRWLVGAVDGRTWTQVAAAGTWILTFLVVAAVIAPWVELLVGDHPHAQAVGVPVGRIRAVLLGCTIALVAGAVALAGAVSFIGLAVPHLTRAWIGRAPRPSATVVTALTGAVLLVACDALAQLITGQLAASATSIRLGIPAGAVASVCGAIALIVLTRPRRMWR
jgi:iron complex transport system permease protein